VPDLSEQINEVVDGAASRLIDLSHSIHADPEIGLSETRSAARVVEAIESLTNVHVQRGIGPLPTAFRADYGTGDLCIVLCAEYDALPEIGHGCGHNLIAAAAVGAFAALVTVADRIGASVRLLGTPAEENGGGKIVLLSEGAFDGAHAAMMIHPGPTDELSMNPYASTLISAEYCGRAAHASFAPHEGVNALDALTVTLTAIGLARQQLPPGSQIHGYVTHGGEAPNIIPAAAGAAWMLRAEDLERLEQVVDTVTRCIDAGGLATGAKVTIERGAHSYSHFLPDPDLSTAYTRRASDRGRAAGRDTRRGGSTDMGNVSLKIPSLHPMLSLGNPDVALHTADFAKLAGGAAGDAAVVDGAILMAQTIVDVATTPEVRSRLLNRSQQH
jgi:amidohydrolase